MEQAIVSIVVVLVRMNIPKMVVVVSAVVEENVLGVMGREAGTYKENG
ncbi:MAG: hypothetical protein NC344_01260 [Bacteroidales bacterium]|nr:hypothetical protein [Bacteroidales bacterium]MCM1146465.1 hypothetical protein [Bacteroidales bacterium]MCM1205097.1 hypothetical protein [Bacillota bacterium]MCM1509343.1 hypothetical protein [Clostridium sp.]